MGYLLGYDAGSSSVKATLLDIETGRAVASAASPRDELGIDAPQPGWAEQDPDVWWVHLRGATARIGERSGVDLRAVKAIGISYQMHGLVVVGRDLEVLRPAIIWCDSRAVSIGDAAFSDLGEGACLGRLLNSPGNFTASRLKWVMENQPDIFGRIHKAMLPGDYLAMRMTGDVSTTPSGLSEMVLWDFEEDRVADMVLDHYGISPRLLPDIRPTFSVQGQLTREAAGELGLEPGTPVSYRAGDQPNNAFSLGVLDAGEVAATAGTSGVVYGVTDKPQCDQRSRVNIFVHVNHTTRNPRYGALLCVNVAGMLNQWLRRNLVGAGPALDYEAMNELAASAPAGSDGLLVLPFGNGAERTLENRDIGASVHGLDLNVHGRAHLLRAAQEGIVFALYYGLEIMRDMGIEVEGVRAGKTNMFQSPVFCEAFANVTGTVVELYGTDGSQGAARGAGLGAAIYKNVEDAYRGLELMEAIRPEMSLTGVYGEAYACWREILMGYLER
jgi:xylulokinase